MRAFGNRIAITLAIFGLAACATGDPGDGTAEIAPVSTKTAAPMPVAAPKPITYEPAAAPLHTSPASKSIAFKYRNPPAPLAKASSPITTSRKPASVEPPISEPKPDDDTASQIQRIDAYFNSMKTAAYTFNPPSPIQVAKPVTVHLWLNPQATSATLAEELKKAVPRDAARVESGQTRWSPKMRAALSGPDFDVKAVGHEEQLVSSTQRTTWSWDITPLHPGENLALHLRLEAILPPEFGVSQTITSLDREIKVEVTWWWLFDHYFEKYWKWLLGGLGTAMASVIAWWWKNRKAASKDA